MKILTLLCESKMLFNEYHSIRIDPDRDDLYDVADKLLPAFVKMAYKNLVSDKERHEAKHGEKSSDEDAYNFEFTEDALLNEFETLTSLFAEKLKNLSSKEIKDLIKLSSKDFKEPLE